MHCQKQGLVHCKFQQHNLNEFHPASESHRHICIPFHCVGESNALQWWCTVSNAFCSIVCSSPSHSSTTWDDTPTSLTYNFHRHVNYSLSWYMYNMIRIIILDVNCKSTWYPLFTSMKYCHFVGVGHFQLVNDIFSIISIPLLWLWLEQTLHSHSMRCHQAVVF